MLRYSSLILLDLVPPSMILSRSPLPKIFSRAILMICSRRRLSADSLSRDQLLKLLSFFSLVALSRTLLQSSYARLSLASSCLLSFSVLYRLCLSLISPVVLFISQSLDLRIPSIFLIPVKSRVFITPLLSALSSVSLIFASAAPIFIPGAINRVSRQVIVAR